MLLAGAMARRSLLLPTAGARYWPPTTICASAPARRVMPWLLAAPSVRRSPVMACCLKQAEVFRARPANSAIYSPNAAASDARTSTPSRNCMPAQAATAARQRCGTCIDQARGGAGADHSGRSRCRLRNHQPGGRPTLRWPGTGTRSAKAPGKAAPCHSIPVATPT